MKLVTFELDLLTGKTSRLGVLKDDNVVDLVSAYALYLHDEKSSFRAHQLSESIIGKDMLAFIQGGEYSLEAAKTALNYIDSKDLAEIIGPNEEKIIYNLNEVKLKVPLQPVSIRDSLNNETHFQNSLKEVGLTEIPSLFYERPYYYRTSHTAIAGPEDKIKWPSFGEKLDFELEFAIVIGKKGTNIKAEDAHEYIFGYTIFNDISIRDYQQNDMKTMMGPSKSKNFTHGNILGPCITTSDEIDPSNLRLQARVNNEVWSDRNSSDMYYSFPELIEFISKEETLYPGEVICSGTMAYGCGLELGRFLKPNDMIELEVEGIGILRNQIIK
mgnify:CR=1 FL=1